MSKVIVKNHRAVATSDDVDMVLTVIARTHMFLNESGKSETPTKNRVEVVKATLSYLEAIGLDATQYMDAFPTEWDVEVQ